MRFSRPQFQFSVVLNKRPKLTVMGRQTDVQIKAKLCLDDAHIVYPELEKLNVILSENLIC